MSIDELAPNYVRDDLDEYTTGKTNQEMEQEAIRALMTEAWSENYEFDRKKAREKKDQAEHKFWLILAGFFAVGYRAEIIDGEWTIYYDGYRFKVKHAVSFWKFPESVEVYYPRSNRWSRGGKNYTKYRLLKRGGYKYSEIARDVIAYAIADIENAKAEKRRTANSDEAKEVRRTLRLRSYANVRVTPSTEPAKPVRVEFKIDRSMTSLQAIELVNMLKELGATASYDFLKEGEEFKED